MLLFSPTPFQVSVLGGSLISLCKGSSVAVNTHIRTLKSDCHNSGETWEVKGKMVKTLSGGKHLLQRVNHPLYRSGDYNFVLKPFPIPIINPASHILIYTLALSKTLLKRCHFHPPGTHVQYILTTLFV